MPKGIVLPCAVFSALLTLGFLALGPALLGQGRTDVIRGHVVDDSGKAIAGAQIVATRGPDRISLFTQTHPDGNYEIPFPNGPGDYLVHISALGMDAFRKRVTRVATESVFVVNAQLHSALAALEAVRVRAAAVRKLERGDVFGGELSYNAPAGSYSASVAPSLMGDITATAATVPGIRATDRGIAAFGLPAAQSTTTLNGMAFDGSFIPLDAEPDVHINSSIYDAAHGGYSGAETAVDIRPGSWLATKRAHLILDASPLQVGLHTPSGPSQQYTAVDAGFGRTGELVERTWVYRIAAQGSYRTTPLLTVANGGSAESPNAGLSADSRARVNSVLTQLGIPDAGTGLPDRATRGQGSFIVQLDRTPSQRVSLSELFYLGGISAAGTGVNAITSSAAALTNHRFIAFDELQRSAYFADRRGLNETRIGVNLTSAGSDGSTSLPTGTVLVASAVRDSIQSVTAVSFGGSPLAPRSRKLASVYLRNETTRMNLSGTHHFKLAAEVGLNHSTIRDGTNSRGAFYYSSLADLAAGSPAQFARTTGSEPMAGGLWRGFVSLGDFWRPSDDFQLMYGARIETERFANSVLLKPDVRNAFGLMSNVPREQVAVSPRLGFRWVYRQSVPQEFGAHTNSLGVFENQGPRFVLRGGIGAFRSTPQASLLSDAATVAGTPFGAQRLLCLGAAIPTPNWGAFAIDQKSIPASCNEGWMQSISDVSPSVAFIDPGYRAPTSWRGNLSVTSQFLGWRATIDGTISLDRNQPSTKDLNFTDVAQFYTSDENRPVYAAFGDIVPATGTVSPVDARRRSEFGRIIAVGSDGSTVNRALTLKLEPDYGLLGDGLFSLSYTLSSGRSRERGFDATTFTSPVALESGRDEFTPRHQFIVEAGYLFGKGFSASLFGDFWSGLPFTPIVGGDVNGDGRANDRAFVFDPATAVDASLASGMAALLRENDSPGSHCIASQIGRVASRASCIGPWTGQLNARFDVPGERIGLGGRTRIALVFTNTLGALDQLVHGAGSTRGWGANLSPDPVLYAVRGFDPAQKRFHYEVNSHFGRPLSNGVVSPFGVTLAVSIDFSESADAQQLRRTVNSGRLGHTGVRMSADSITTRYSHVVPDPYAYLMFYSDSLLLTTAQIRAIRAADSVYRHRLDSLWRPLGGYLYDLPAGYDAAASVRVVNATVDSAWDLTKLEEPKIRRILSAIQWEVTPHSIKLFLDPKFKPHYALPG